MDDNSNKPTPSQVAWLFSHLLRQLEKPISLYQFVHEVLGFDSDAYQEIWGVGGMEVLNALEMAAAMTGAADFGPVEEMTDVPKPVVKPN